MDGTTCLTLTISIVTASAQTWDILVAQIESGTTWEAPAGNNSRLLLIIIERRYLDGWDSILQHGTYIRW